MIDLECPECIPDNMALVTSHSAFNGTLSIPSGEEVTMACSGGKFLVYPLLESLTAVCEGGKYRVRSDGSLKHLLDLGCQANLFEDVLHTVSPYFQSLFKLKYICKSKTSLVICPRFALLG